MKRFLFFIAVAAMAASVSAATQEQEGKVFAPGKKLAHLQSERVKEIPTSERHELPLTVSPLSSRGNSHTTSPVKHHYRAPGDYSEPITEVEGEVKQYESKKTFYLENMEGLNLISKDGLDDIVYGKDGKVYFNKLLGGFNYGNVYIEGELQEDGKIKVTLPQTVYYDSYEDEVDNMSRTTVVTAELLMFDFKYDEEGYITYEIYYADEEDAYATYSIDSSTGAITLDLNEGFVMPEEVSDLDQLPKFAVGALYHSFGHDRDDEFDDLYFYGSADVAQTYLPFNETVTAIPDNLKTETWGIVSESEITYDNRILNVAFDEANKKVYLSNLSPLLPDAAVVGVINENGTVTFPTKQFLGIDDGYLMRMVACLYNDFGTFQDYTMLEEINFLYDREAKTLTCDNPHILMAVNCYKDDLYFTTGYMGPVIKYQTLSDMDASPLNPIFEEYFEKYDPYTDNLLYCWVMWELPIVNTNMYVFDENRMYYNTFVDGELFTCEKDVYVNDYLEEDMTDIPFTFHYIEDGWISGSINWFKPGHMLYFFEGTAEFSCQTFYKNEEGKIFRSDIVIYDVETGEVTTEESGINEVSSFEVMDLYYTNLQGQIVNNPTHGIFIRTVVMKDGTRKSEKIMID